MEYGVEVTPIPASQMRQLIQWMGAYGIAPRQTLERAGQALALLARRLLDDDVTGRPIVVLAGQGVKGAGGLVAARHLANNGAWVQIILTYPPANSLIEDEQSETAQQLASLRELDAPLAWAEEGWELPPADLVIDTLIDMDEEGEPGEEVRNLIHLANSSMAPVLSLDAPSGLETTTGRLATPFIQAAATLSLISPRLGLLAGPGRSACGDLYLADIGAPPALYAQLGLRQYSPFPRDTISQLAVIQGKAFILKDAL